MSRTINTIATINSVIRTALALVIVGGIGFAGYAYTAHQRLAAKTRRELVELSGQLEQAQGRLERTQQELEAKQVQVRRQSQQIAEQARQIEKLDVSLRLLKVDNRVARLSVLAQDEDPETGVVHSVVEFVELDQRGEPLDRPKRFTIEGDLVYIDNLVVKFDDQYIENADLHRGTSLVMFRRIFGEYQQPQRGFPLETVGQRPKVYSSDSAPTEFEQKIWSDFWSIANDRRRAQQLGIRPLHGEAVSVRVRPGNAYRIVLRASDGLSIQLEGDAPARRGRDT